MTVRAARAAILAAAILSGCSASSKAPSSAPPGFEEPWPWPGANYVATSVTLSFPFSGAGVVFDVYLAASSVLPDVPFATSVTVSTLAVADLASDTGYSWKAVARDAGGGKTESATWSFVTGTGSYPPGTMCPVAGWSFIAGATPVVVSSFQMDRFEVTFELWTAVRTWGSTHGYTDLPVGQNGSSPLGGSNPVTNVSWYDAVKWCNARSEWEGTDPVYFTDATQTTVYRTGQIALGNDAVSWSAPGYRLPTEVEWDYAARGGRFSRGYPYAGASIPGNVAWYDGNAGNRTHTAGTRSANELGLFDLSGNVFEWIWDGWSPVYPVGGSTDPRGPATAQTYRVVRGGCFQCADVTLGPAYRGYDADGPAHGSWLQGFRTVRRP
jgi:formylglycine-generating enzyme required for sulfatase activity